MTSNLQTVGKGWPTKSDISSPYFNMKLLFAISFLIAWICTVFGQTENVSDGVTVEGTLGVTVEGTLRVCFAKTVFNGRVINIEDIGAVEAEEAALFEGGRIWRRPSRIRPGSLSGNTHGRGSANLIVALCQACRRNKKERCIRRFCTRRRRGSRVRIEVVCPRLL